MWPMWPKGIPRKLITNISGRQFGLIGPAMESGSISVPKNLGRMGVYRCPASGGDAVLLSKDPNGVEPQESFDGKQFILQAERQTRR